MTKAQIHSIERIKLNARIIEENVAKELEREARQRKRAIESAYQSLTTHAHKLNISLPRLSTFYDPQQYLDHTRHILKRVEELSKQ